MTHGQCSTPMLHWLVSQQLTNPNDSGAYISHFKNKFMKFMSLCKGRDLYPKQNYENELHLDCANGVGAQIMSQLIQMKDFTDILNIKLFNNEESFENLNLNCGAEFVHK